MIAVLFPGASLADVDSAAKKIEGYFFDIDKDKEAYYPETVAISEDIKQQYVNYTGIFAPRETENSGGSYALQGQMMTSAYTEAYPQEDGQTGDARVVAAKSGSIDVQIANNHFDMLVNHSSEIDDYNRHDMGYIDMWLQSYANAQARLSPEQTLNVETGSIDADIHHNSFSIGAGNKLKSYRLEPLSVSASERGYASLKENSGEGRDVAKSNHLTVQAHNNGVNLKANHNQFSILEGSSVQTASIAGFSGRARAVFYHFIKLDDERDTARQASIVLSSGKAVGEMSDNQLDISGGEISSWRGVVGVSASAASELRIRNYTWLLPFSHEDDDFSITLRTSKAQIVANQNAFNVSGGDFYSNINDEYSDRITIPLVGTKLGATVAMTGNIWQQYQVTLRKPVRWTIEDGDAEVLAKGNQVNISGGNFYSPVTLTGVLAQVQVNTMLRAGGAGSMIIQQGDGVKVNEQYSSHHGKEKITLIDNQLSILGGNFARHIDNVSAIFIDRAEENFVNQIDVHHNQVSINHDVKVNNFITAATVKKNSFFGKKHLLHEWYLTDNSVTLGGKVSLGKQSYLLGVGISIEEERIEGEGEDRLYYLVDIIDSDETFSPYKHDTVDFFTGNTLNLVNYRGDATGATVGNFQYYHFALPSDFEVNKSVALAVDTIYLDNANQSEKFAQHASIGHVSYAGDVAKWRKGDALWLVKANRMEGQLANEGQQYVFKKSALMNTVATLVRENNAIKLMVGDSYVVPESKSINEAQLASAVLVQQGANLWVNRGIQAASEAVQERPSNGFATMAGSKGRYKTGSYVDMNAWTWLAGLSHRYQTRAGQWTVGAFFEAGQGNYDTVNGVENGTVARGHGKSHYEGGGIFAQLEASNGVYADASVRLGRVHNRFTSHALFDHEGRAVSYRTAVPYQGFHIGAGYKWWVGKDIQADVYGQYVWSRQDSKDVTLSSGDKVHFDAIHSERVRLGGRVNFAKGQRVRPYVGVAYEYEFSGKAGATTQGLTMNAPRLRGSSGVLEAGLRILPDTAKAWMLEASIQGYTGKRREIAGGLQAVYRF